MESVTIGVVVHFLASLALIIRVLTRPHREPASRIAWIAVIAALPIVGILAYVFLGKSTLDAHALIRGERSSTTCESRLPNILQAMIKRWPTFQIATNTCLRRGSPSAISR